MPQSWSTGEAAAEFTTSVDDLNRKIDVYSDQLFRQARWEAELLGSDLRLADLPPLAERAVQSAERATATLDRIAPDFERAVAVAESTPALVASERKAAIDALGEDLTRTITFLQQERIAALQQVTAERIAAINAISQTVTEERKALHQDIKRIGLELVDHAVWRLAQLVAAVLVVLGVGTVATLVLVRKLSSRLQGLKRLPTIVVEVPLHVKRSDLVDEQLDLLAAHLSKRRSIVLQAWRTAVEADPEVSTANALPRRQFIDHVPAILDALERRLRHSPRRKSADARVVRRMESAVKDWSAGSRDTTSER